MASNTAQLWSQQHLRSQQPSMRPLGAWTEVFCRTFAKDLIALCGRVTVVESNQNWTLNTPLTTPFSIFLCSFLLQCFEVPWMRWRRFDFGGLATLLMLETRLWARTSQATLPTALSFWPSILSVWPCLEAEVTTESVHNEIGGLPKALQKGRISGKEPVVQVVMPSLTRLSPLWSPSRTRSQSMFCSVLW